MAIPPKARSFVSAMDPTDITDFAIKPTQGDTASAFLQSAEDIVAFAITLSAEAIAAGVSLKTTGGYSTTVLANVITFYPIVSPAMQGNAMFDGAGLVVAMEVQTTTNSTPPRVRTRTMLLTVSNL